MDIFGGFEEVILEEIPANNTKAVINVFDFVLFDLIGEFGDEVFLSAFVGSAELSQKSGSKGGF